MIRFIDLRGMMTGYNFAFWNTVTDKFVALEGSEAWLNWTDFERDLKTHLQSPVFSTQEGRDTVVDVAKILKRYRNITPEWAHNEYITGELSP